MSQIDLSLEWGQDLALTPQGTLLFVSGWDRVRQRIIRRILTNPSQALPDGSSTPADYLFDATYGVGGGALVSQNPTRAWENALRQRVTQGVLSDAAVNSGFLPQIVIQKPQPNMILIFVGLTLLSGEAKAFGISLGSHQAPLTDEAGNALKDESGDELFGS